jgi:hypothetical protein
LAGFWAIFFHQKYFPYIKSLCFRSKFDKNWLVKESPIKIPIAMHIFSYDFFFKKRDDSIFSWLPLPTYPKKMVIFKKKKKKKKIPQNLAHFGPFFSTQNSFPYIKIICVKSAKQNSTIRSPIVIICKP